MAKIYFVITKAFVICIYLLISLPFPSFAQTPTISDTPTPTQASPSATVSPTLTSTPAPTDVTPTSTLSPTPTNSPFSQSASSTPTPTTAQAVGASSKDDNKKQILGKTSVLGSTGTDKEIAKWAIASLVGFCAIFIGFRIMHTNAQE